VEFFTTFGDLNNSKKYVQQSKATKLLWSPNTHNESILGKTGETRPHLSLWKKKVPMTNFGEKYLSTLKKVKFLQISPFSVGLL